MPRIAQSLVYTFENFERHIKYIIKKLNIPNISHKNISYSNLCQINSCWSYYQVSVKIYKYVYPEMPV